MVVALSSRIDARFGYGGALAGGCALEFVYADFGIYEKRRKHVAASILSDADNQGRESARRRSVHFAADQFPDNFFCGHRRRHHTYILRLSLRFQVFYERRNARSDKGMKINEKNKTCK